MRNRDYFLPSITTLILFGMVWFLSCAHQNKFRDEADLAFEQAAEEQASENQESQEQSPEEVAAKSEEEKTLETAELAPKPEETATTETAPVAEAPSEAAATAEISKELENGAPEVQPETVTEAPEPEVQIEEVPKAQPRKAYTPRTPKVPRKAFARKGSNLNRFYFARKGDSPKKVSQLIYSDIKFAKKLARWNGRVWSPGQIIFYASPVQPKDKAMISFYQERNLQPEEYHVKNGDWLTRIALKKLGSVLSWKELAVLNGLKTPNSLERDQTLAVYPRNLFKALEAPVEQKQAKLAEPPPAPESYKPEPILAKPTEPAPRVETKAPEQAPVVEPPPVKAEAPVVEPSPFGQEQQAANDSEGEAEQPPATATNWNQVIEQNSIAILIGAALIILLLALTARKKRLKARASSSSSDADSEGVTEDTPSKFRRR